MTWLSKYQPQLLAILRIVAGLLFLEHGTMKLFGFPAAMHVPPGHFAYVIIAAGIIETVGGVLVTIGLFTRYAAFIMSGEMAIAYWLVHVGQSHVFWPALNGGGEAILDCFVFLYLAAAGPGAWSLNRK